MSPFPRMHRLTAMVFMVTLLVSSGFLFLLVRLAETELRVGAAQIALAHAKYVERHLNDALSVTEHLADIIQSQGAIRDFDAVARDLIARHEGVSALALAPGAVVRQFYPLSGNEKAIGHDLLADPDRRAEALAAIESRKLTLAGPFELIQGGTAVIGRYPVFVSGADGQQTFWGFTIALIRMPAFLSLTALHEIEKAGYLYTLSRIPPGSSTPVIFFGTSSAELKKPVLAEIAVPNGTWILSLEPATGWYSRFKMAVGIGVCLLITALAGVFTQKLMNAQAALRASNRQLVREVATRREAEAVLKTEKETARRYLDVAGVIILALDRDGRVSLINRRGADVLGLPADSIVGRDWFREFLPESEFGRIRMFFDRLMAGQQETIAYAENEIRRADGSHRWIAWHNSVLRDEGGRITGTLSSGEDITDRRRMERELRAAIATTEKQRRNIAFLLQGARSVLVHDDFNQAARALSRLAQKATDATVGCIALRPADGKDHGASLLAVGEDDSSASFRFSPVVQRLADAAWETGRAVWDNRVSGEPPYRNVLLAPMKEKNTVAGMVCLANKPAGFSEDDDRIVTALAEFAAIAYARDRNMAALTHSEERFRSVVQTAADAVMTIDAEGTITFWNRAAERIFGHTAKEAIGQPVTLIMPENLEKRHHEAFARAVRDGRLTGGDSPRGTIGLRKTGDQVPVEISLASWMGPDGLQFTGIIRDLSERMDASRRLAESEARYRDLVERIPVVTYTVSLEPNNPVLFMSPQCRELLGQAPEDFNVGLDIWNRNIHADDRRRVLEELSRSFSEERPYYAEYRYVRPDGRILWIRDEADYVGGRSGHATSLQGVMIDITEQKRLEEELLRSEERERRRIGQDLHDGLGQILTGVAFKSRALERSLADDPRTAMAAEITALVDQAKEMARNLAHGLAPEVIESLGLYSALDSLAARSRSMFGVSCDLVFEGQSEAPELESLSIVSHLYHIAQEAVTNAVKHGRASRILIRIGFLRNRLVLDIEDNGSGFTETPHENRGMGLRIMGYRARLCGGSLHVGAMSGGGTRVRCSLPLTIRNRPQS